MLKLLLLLLSLEAPGGREGDSRGSPPPPASSIRMSPRTPSPSRSGENTGGAPWGSSNSAKLKGSRSGGVVTMETRGEFNMIAIAAAVEEEEKMGCREEVLEEMADDDRPPAWSSSSCKTEQGGSSVTVCTRVLPVCIRVLPVQYVTKCVTCVCNRWATWVYQMCYLCVLTVCVTDVLPVCNRCATCVY